MTNINLNVGDILENRETRRKGKQIKVIALNGDSIRVENYRNADNALLNSVGKQYDIKASRILNDYKIVKSSSSEDTNPAPVLMPRPEEQEREVILFIPNAEAPLTPEEEEEFASLASENFIDSKSDAEVSDMSHPQMSEKDDLGTPSIFGSSYLGSDAYAGEEDEDSITPEQEADLHEALKSVGYYKLPNKDALIADITKAIEFFENENDEELELDVDTVVELVYEAIKIDD